MASVRSSGPRRPETLLQLSGEPIFLLGPTGRFLYVNPAWEELTGVPAAEVLGRDAVYSNQDTASELLDCFCPPVEAIGGAPASTLGLIRRRPDGLRLWRRLEFWPHRDRDGRPLFVFGVVRLIEQAALAPESPSTRLREELWRVREYLIDRLGTEMLIGSGAAHRRLVAQIEAASAVNVPVLIVGPPGSGKRQVARAIHRKATRPDSLLVPIDCAALPSDVLDRELFGPSASESDGKARLNLADGATLMLGDLLDLPRDVQARLAEALTYPEGSSVRVLAVTSGDPEEALRSDQLRADLYYALSTFLIRLAPLRERLDELPVLAQHFLDRANHRDGPRRLGFHPEAIEVLLRYDWPGNLRELARVVDFAHARADQDSIGPEHLPPTIQGHLGAAYLPPAPSPEQFPLDVTLERLERRLMEQALRTARGNKSLAAKMLHISRTRLHRRIQELGLAGASDGDGGDLASPDEADQD